MERAHTRIRRAPKRQEIPSEVARREEETPHRSSLPRTPVYTAADEQQQCASWTSQVMSLGHCHLGWHDWIVGRHSESEVRNYITDHYAALTSHVDSDHLLFAPRASNGVQAGVPKDGDEPEAVSESSLFSDKVEPSARSPVGESSAQTPRDDSANHGDFRARIGIFKSTSRLRPAPLR